MHEHHNRIQVLHLIIWMPTSGSPITIIRRLECIQSKLDLVPLSMLLTPWTLQIEYELSSQHFLNVNIIPSEKIFSVAVCALDKLMFKHGQFCLDHISGGRGNSNQMLLLTLLNDLFI